VPRRGAQLLAASPTGEHEQARPGGHRRHERHQDEDRVEPLADQPGGLGGHPGVQRDDVGMVQQRIEIDLLDAVSRVDVLIDPLLDKKAAAETDPARRTKIEGLRGKAAIAPRAA